MTKQAVKKGAGIKKFSVQNFKNELLGEVSSKTADKELEWIMMPKAYQEAINLPGIPMGRGVTFIRGWSDTGKSTLKNLAIANAMKQGILPVIFETEGNFDFQYAKDCGMAIEPVYDDVEYTDEETGEITVKREIVDWEGDYFLFTNTKMCEFCGDMDYSTSTRKSKKRKVKRIANVREEAEEDFPDEEIEEDIEDEFEEEAYDDMEEHDEFTENEDYIDEEDEKDNDEEMEKTIHEKMINEKMRQYYDKTVNNTKNKSEEKKGRNRKNK